MTAAPYLYSTRQCRAQLNSFSERLLTGEIEVSSDGVVGNELSDQGFVRQGVGGDRLVYSVPHLDGKVVKFANSVAATVPGERGAAQNQGEQAALEHAYNRFPGVIPKLNEIYAVDREAYRWLVTDRADPIKMKGKTPFYHAPVYPIHPEFGLVDGDVVCIDFGEGLETNPNGPSFGTYFYDSAK